MLVPAISSSTHAEAGAPRAAPRRWPAAVRDVVERSPSPSRAGVRTVRSVIHRLADGSRGWTTVTWSTSRGLVELDAQPLADHLGAVADAPGRGGVAVDGLAGRSSGR